MNGYYPTNKSSIRSKSSLPRMSNTVEFLVDKIQIVKETQSHRTSRTSRTSTYFEKIVGQKERWSWKVLKQEFKAKDSCRLFDKYQSRIQHTFFMVLLMLNIFFNIIAIIVYFFDKRNQSPFAGSVLLRISSLLVFIIFFIMTCFDEQLFRPKISRTICSVTVLIAMLFEEYGGALFSLQGDTNTYSLQRIRPTFYLIIANHILLPYPSRIYSCLTTFFIIAIELVLTFSQRVEMHCGSQLLAKFSIADSFFYFFSAIFGLYMTFLLEIAIRRAFMNHRSCVESTFKLDYEQEQQEQLLNSCLPQHLTDKVRSDIRELISKIARQEKIPQRPFNKLYVNKYKNVSILYADIVNSMLLGQSLSPNDLVETLNELFGRFDECAEKNNCLRIKLLGDCYYCVSGVPNYDENHASNCVRMGLDMIKIIRTVREDREINVDMRIGIHSGMVLSGLLGVHKWQYDIWSIDSMIASNMEHHGKPGYVHITKTTLDLIPDDQKVDLIITEKVNEEGEIGYLIIKRDDNTVTRTMSESPKSKRKRQTDTLKAQINKLRRRSSFESMPICHRQTILETSLKKYQQMVKSVNEFMDSAIEEMPLSIKTQWLHPHSIHPIFLYFSSSNAVKGKKLLFERERFSPWSLEWDFAQQTDTFFSFYLFCAGALCITMMAIKLIIPQLSVIFVHKLSFVVTLFIICVALFYTYFKSHQLSFFFRILIWFVISASLLVCSMMDIIVKDCDYMDHISNNNITDMKRSVDLARCAYSWDYTLCIILAMTGTSLFIRINLWLKFFMHLIGVLIYIILFFNKCSIYEIIIRKTDEDNLLMSNIGFNPRIGHIYYVIMVAVLLHVIDRQIEYIFRLDFQWTNRLIEERLEAETMGEINRILLENILPVHVAQRYLYNSSISADQLYHESYESCAVMFASIPNYSQFYSENNLNDEGKECLKLLNEIICYFDQMLSHVDFQRIEKIKTIGSTYMAAAGLQPGRGSTDSEVSIEDMANNVIVLVRFATALMETLQRINKDALQDFKLRVGIAVGPVVAGVVGAVKPQYDIWGDTVNVSSRMDSTGIMGRIQITAEAADMLKNCDISEEFILEKRGPIMVKGKGELITYLVKTQFDFDEHEITRV